MTAFGSRLLKTSSESVATITNENDVMVLPEQVLFDQKGNLWLTNCSDALVGAGTVSEYTAQQVSQFSTNPSANPHVILADDGSLNTFNCAYGEAFDSNGNLWVSNLFGSNIVEFTPSQLEVGGNPIPNTQIFSSFTGPEGIQFDASGTLWVTDVQRSQIFGFRAATLAGVEGTSTQVPPDITNSSTSLLNPTALLITRSGDQWVANFGANSLLEFAAVDLTETGSPTPIVTLTATSVTTPSGSSLSINGPQGVIFDKQGNLWVSNAESDNTGSIAKFTPAQIAATGSPSPTVFLDSDPDGDNINDPVLISFGPNVR